jgi:hypothetical protein
MKTKTNYQFDFKLFINDKIICQRFFKDRNFEKDSIDFNEAIEIITVTTNLIQSFIKSESIKFLWKKYDCNSEKKMFYVAPRNELFVVTISYNSTLLASSCFEGSFYPPIVKYNVDIRPIIPRIYSNIRLCLVE